MCCLNAMWYYMIGMRKPLNESDGSRLSAHFENADECHAEGPGLHP